MTGGDRMTEKDLADMIKAEEKRLGVGSRQFMERHQEIMDLIERMEREYKKRPCQTDTLTGAGNPTN